MDPEKKSLKFTFPTKYVIPKSLKFSHWPSKWFTMVHSKKSQKQQIQEKNLSDLHSIIDHQMGAGQGTRT